MNFCDWIPGKTVLFCLLLLPLFSLHSRAGESAIETIRQRLIRKHYRENNVDQNDVRRMMENMTSDGSWPDVNYDDRSRTAWDPIEHLNRLRQMAHAATAPDSDLRGKRGLLNRVRKGLRFWFEREPEASNWWWNDIGVPLKLGPILLLMRERLPEELLRKGIDRMPNQLRQHAGTDMDEILNDEFLIHRGLVADNSDLIRKAFDHMLSDLAVKSSVGIKADFSFHNHGPQLYNGGYGLPTTIAWAEWAYLARGTRLEFPVDKRRLLAEYVIEGHQWMTWYELIDFGALGRNISRKGPHVARSLLPALRKLARIVPSKREEITSFARHIKGNPPQISGNKNFWLSDFMVHRRTNYYTSVSLTSEDVVGTEILNSEGIQSYYLPYGCNFIYHGPPGEYRAVLPVWNWTRVPGVTAPHRSEPPSAGGKIQGKTDFVGGVSNGTYGLSAFDYDLDDTSARKSWFFFDRECVALGAGIRSGSAHPLITTVNQSLRDGDLLFAEGTSSMERLSHGEARTMTSPVRVHHDGVGYVFPRNGDPVHLDSSSQTGSWNRINRQYGDDRISKRVFNLWQEHGKKPDEDSYFYVVAPGVKPERLRAYQGDSSPVTVLSNSSSLQAVRHKNQDLTMMAFYKPGNSLIDDRRTLSVDTPCLVIVARGEDGYAISVANPEGDAANVQVRIHSNQDEEVIGERTFELPGGQEGGRSVTHRIRMK